MKRLIYLNPKVLVNTDHIVSIRIHESGDVTVWLSDGDSIRCRIDILELATVMDATVLEPVMIEEPEEAAKPQDVVE